MVNTKVKLAIIPAILLIFFIPTALADYIPGDNSIQVKILSWSVYPKEVQPGGTIDVTAKIQITLTQRNDYSLLVESSVVPQGVPYSLLPLLDVIPHAKCCPGNDNFDDAILQETYSVWEVGYPKTITETVHLQLKAPTPDSYDHCAPSGSDRRNPGFYWNGPGEYLVTLSVWNGCASDVTSDLIKYAGDYKIIKIVVPQQQYCGNGVCESGEDSQTCPQDCSVTNQILNTLNKTIGSTNLKYSDILIIAGIVGIALAIIYKKR